MNKTADLAYWINERYSIKMRRDWGIPPPWTSHPVMASTRFCNVHREDDKVTKWLAVNWRPRYNAVWQILLARLINNIATLECILTLMPKGALNEIRDRLKYRRNFGAIFGSAYTVSTNGLSMDKVDYIIDRVVLPAKDVKTEEFWEHFGCPTLQQACQDLIRLHGVSTFMAGQIIADLKNTEGHELSKAKDFHTWSAPGPGSLRGLSEYFGRPITAGAYLSAVTECYEEVSPLVMDYVPPIHMQDFQNCLCEFSKFMRVSNGGHARNRYRPTP